jgi:Molybdopterin converting factor, large subunit
MQGRTFQTIASLAIYVDINGLGCLDGGEGFKCCMFIIDSLKNRVPIWKQDVYEDGTKKWH